MFLDRKAVVSGRLGIRKANLETEKAKLGIQNANLEIEESRLPEAERRLSVVGEAPYGDDTPFGDDVESAVEVGLARSARLRRIIPEGEAVLRSAFEGRLA